MQGHLQTARAILFPILLVFLFSNSSRADGPISMSFSVPYLHDSEIVTVQYTEEGPIGGGSLFRGAPLVKVGRYYYGRRNQEIIKVDSENGSVVTIKPGPGLPELSWPRDVAYDSKRNRLVVASLGGEGFLYAIDPDSGAWSVIASLENRDIDSIAYSPTDDNYYAVQNVQPGNDLIIHRISPDGTRLSLFTIMKFPFEIGGAYTSRLVLSTPAPFFGLLVEPTPGWTPTLPAESRIYRVNPVAALVELIFIRQWDVWPPGPPPPSNTAPEVRFISPVFTGKVGVPINLGIEVIDRQNNAHSVELFDNGTSLRRWLIDPGATGPITFRFQWTPAQEGSHELRLQATDAAGLFNDAILNINIQPATPVLVAERNLPNFYAPGEPLTVTITVRPVSGVDAWALEEQPPADWAISAINESGFYDKTSGKIKWGPFTDQDLHTLSYVATPPSAFGDKYFYGLVSVNGVSQNVEGETTIHRAPSFHPADEPPADSRIVVNELTAYAAVWKRNGDWPRPPTKIPVSYVTRAGLIWKEGEQYKFNGLLEPPACWIPIIARHGVSTPTAGDATRQLAPAFTRGHATKITVHVKPTLTVSAYALEETPPAGWTILDSGEATLANGALRLGPFFDNHERTLTYTALPPNDATRAEFHGEVSFDGSTDAIQGSASLRLPHPLLDPANNHQVRLRFNATPGEKFIVEASNAVEGVEWTELTTIIGADTAVELPPIDALDTQKFYRLRPLTE